jgi:hypothetical protein
MEYSNDFLSSQVLKECNLPLSSILPSGVFHWLLFSKAYRSA